MNKRQIVDSRQYIVNQKLKNIIKAKKAELQEYRKDRNSIGKKSV